MIFIQFDRVTKKWFVLLFLMIVSIGFGISKLDDNRNSGKQKPERSDGSNLSSDSRKRFIGIWTENYIQFGRSKGAIIRNIAQNSPAEKIFQLEDIILGIDGEKVLSSNDVSSRFSIIPAAQRKVVFEILRGTDKLIVSCECLYHPLVDLTPIYETNRVCSLRVVLGGEGNRIMVAPIRYFYHEFSDGGLEGFGSKFKQIVSEPFVGEFHTLNRKRWCKNNEEAEIAIPITLLKRRFDTDIKGNLQEILSESKKTNNSQHYYFIYLKEMEGKQFMGWSIFPRKDDFDWIMTK